MSCSDAEFKFIRRMFGVTLKDVVKSQTITLELGVVLIMKKIKSYRKKKIKKTHRTDGGNKTTKAGLPIHTC